jgi:CheY-like chemotaxis protein
MPGTILVVEDDPATRRSLHAVLGRRGYTVWSESEGEWALARLSAHPVDALVVAARLSDMPGARLAETVREDPQRVELPVVLVGAAGGPAHLTRPVQPERVADEVDALLRRRAPRDPADPRPDREPVVYDLQKTSFGRVFGRVVRQGGGGALWVQGRRGKKVVFFEGGRPIWVHSDQTGETLGQMLVQEGLLSGIELDAVMRERRRSDRALGDLLVARQALTASQLERVLARQIELKLRDLFGWTEGEAVYRAEAPAPPHRREPADPLRIAYWGARLNMELDRLDDALRGEGDRWVRLDPAVREAVLAVEPSAADWLDRLDGSTTLEAAATDPSLGREITVSLLFALSTLGHLSLEPARLASLSEPLRRQIRARVEAELRQVGQPETGEDRARDPNAVARSVEANRARLRGLGLHEVLGVGPSAPPEAVQRAWTRTRRDLDPQKFLQPELDPHVVRSAEANHLMALRAFHVLRDPESAADYEAWQRDPEEDRLPVLRAERHAQAGRSAMGTGDAARAVAAFEAALALWDAPYWRAELAVARALGEDGAAPEQALAACARFPGDPHLSAWRAVVLERLDRAEQAADAFREAMARDPTDPRVRRGAQNLRLRPPKPAKRKLPWMS